MDRFNHLFTPMSKDPVETKSEWAIALKQLVSHNETDMFPLLVYRARPPLDETWPESLPSNEDIRTFYETTDIAIIDRFRFFSKSTLVAENARLRESQQNGGAAFEDKHLIFANAPEGAPTVWNSEEDSVSIFKNKTGEWEHLNRSFSEFMHSLLIDSNPEESDEMWQLALDQLKQA